MSKIHSLSTGSSILTLACHDSLVFAATQSGLIQCWSVVDMELKATLSGHCGHVFAMALDRSGKLLFSAGEEGLVCVWNLNELNSQTEPKSVVYAGVDCGDILSLAFHGQSQTVFLGCKDTSIQFFKLNSCDDCLTREEIVHAWSSRKSRFFRDLRVEEEHLEIGSVSLKRSFIPDTQIIEMAHHGFIHALAVVSRGEDDFLISGAGDGYVKLWSLKDHTPTLQKSLKVTYGAVLSLACHGGLLVTGAQDGEIKVWDLETHHCIRTLLGQSGDIVSLAFHGQAIITASSDGGICRWSRKFEMTHEISSAHTGSVHCLAVSNGSIVSGGSDNYLNIWDIPKEHESDDQLADPGDRLLHNLKQFVAYESVSGDLSRREDCRRCAKYLKNLFVSLGADSQIIPGIGDTNPLVFAKFTAHSSFQNPLNILFYGHYDVQPAAVDKWTFPPFQLTGQNGYLYGRGVTDNKGPILATLFAISELYDERKLPANVYFVIEGEEESGSGGLEEAIEQHMTYFGNLDLILISNSYWIDDESPCLTYGLRGVIHTTLKVTSPIEEDLHSGVHGGAYDEVLSDLVKILGSLTDHQCVLIPNFYDNVRECTADERESYRLLLENIKPNPRCPNSVENLIARWRYPSLTVHGVEVSGNASDTVIPRSATASVSMRIVPDQDPEQICQAYEEHLKKAFLSLRTSNRLQISFGKCSSWWYADVEQSPYYQAASRALETEWKVKPIYIREGGTIPAIPYLEKVFKAAVVHIPLGQASDNAHLPNERMSLRNLMAGKRVMRNFLTELSKLSQS